MLLALPVVTVVLQASVMNDAPLDDEPPLFWARIVMVARLLQNNPEADPAMDLLKLPRIVEL